MKKVIVLVLLVVGIQSQEKACFANLRNTRADEALYQAVDKNNVPAALAAIARGANADLIQALVILPGRRNHLQMVEVLLKFGADVNTEGPCGDTILLWAIYDGFVDMVKILLQAGADFNARDHNGRTALEMSLYRNEPKIMQLLLQAGARAKTEKQFKQIIEKLAQLDCNNPELFLAGQENRVVTDPITQDVIIDKDPVTGKSQRKEEAIGTLKAKVLKKAYEDYYRGHPELLLAVAGDKKRFDQTKFFTREFLEKLHREYEEQKVAQK